MGWTVAALLMPFAVAVVVTPLARRLAWKIGAVDRPNSLKIHRQPVAYLGGAAVLLAFFAALALVSQEGGEAVPALWIATVVVASLLVAGVGLTDDLYGVPPRIRLLLHTLAAAILIVGGSVFRGFGNPLVCFPITLFFVVGCINAMNLIDGMDGLATGVAIVAASAIAVLMEMQGERAGALLAGGFAAACAGFLLYNSHPASIFLGDAGSGLLGLVLAVLALRLSATGGGATALPAAVLILGVPVLDTSLAVWRRLCSRQPVSAGDRSHIYDVLLAMGLSQREVWAALCGLAATLAIGVVLIHLLPVRASLPPLLLLAVAVAALLYRIEQWRAPRGYEHRF